VDQYPERGTPPGHHRGPRLRGQQPARLAVRRPGPPPEGAIQGTHGAYASRLGRISGEVLRGHYGPFGSQLAPPSRRDFYTYNLSSRAGSTPSRHLSSAVLSVIVIIFYNRVAETHILFPSFSAVWGKKIIINFCCCLSAMFIL
jgi:hypothetical protein